MKNTVLFAIATKIIKYLGINLTKDVQDLYTEDHKGLLKEMERDTISWEDTPCSWIGRNNPE